MTSKKKETAEQKLLKMIEASGGKTAATASANKKSSKKIDFLTALKKVNVALVVILVICLGTLANEIWRGIKEANADISVSAKKSGPGRIIRPEELLPVFQKDSYYLSDLKRRNIFEPFEEEKTKSIEDVTVPKGKIAKETQNLKLVGISWMDKVETASVMIEDTDKKETYFLRTGEKIGNITVKTIYADSVELGYENEEIIIKYDKSQM
jgi:hypothetical protein